VKFIWWCLLNGYWLMHCTIILVMFCKIIFLLFFIAITCNFAVCCIVIFCSFPMAFDRWEIKDYLLIYLLTAVVCLWVRIRFVHDHWVGLLWCERGRRVASWRYWTRYFAAQSSTSPLSYFSCSLTTPRSPAIPASCSDVMSPNYSRNSRALTAVTFARLKGKIEFFNLSITYSID